MSSSQRKIGRSQTVTSFSSPVGYTYRGLRHRTWSPHLYTIRRMASMPDVRRESSKPTQYPSWRPNFDRWSLWDDYWLERRNHQMPRITSHYSWPYRRQNCLDAPSGYWWNYPSTYHYPKLYVKHDYFDSYYWRRFNDWRYLEPTYAPYRKENFSANVPDTYYTQYVKYMYR